VARALDYVDATEVVITEAGEPRAPSLGRVLTGLGGLIGGFGGAIWLALVTMAERLVRVTPLYETGADVWTHFAAEVAAGAGVWLVLFVGLTAVARVLDAFPRGSARGVRNGLAVVLGASAGAFACHHVLGRSAVWSWLPAPVWWGSTMAVSAVGALGVRWLLSRAPPRRALGWGVLLLALLVPPAVWTLGHYVRAYGNVLGILQVGMAVVAALGARLVALGAERQRGSRSAILMLVALALLTLAASPGSYASRRAVLVWGGVAKHLTLEVLWPLADRDGDGIPAMLWGADPDDHDPRLTPVPGFVTAAGRAPAAPSAAAPGPRPQRDLLFVIVDSTRLDSFEAILARDPRVKKAFGSFGFYARYSTCSTRTDQVLPQLIEGARCDDRPLPGGAPSMLAVLRSAGYRDRAIRYYGVVLRFGVDEIVRDDGVVIDRARRALLAASDAPRALFVHLRGGHNPYDRTEGSPREQYERQIHQAFSRVASLVELATPDRFVVVVLGDHGEAFGEHMSVAHANMLYEEVLKTPLLVQSPLVTPGLHTEAMGCRDVAWQVLSGLGLGTTPGVSSMPSEYAALDINPGQFGRTQTDSLRSLRQGSHKVIYTPQTGAWELYDLVADPGEWHSLADRRPALLGPLRNELLRVASSCPIPPTVGVLRE
jgi:hypothetical protein